MGIRRATSFLFRRRGVSNRENRQPSLLQVNSHYPQTTRRTRVLTTGTSGHVIPFCVDACNATYLNPPYPPLHPSDSEVQRGGMGGP